MEFRQLGYSGLKVPVLCFGTGTFGGSTEFFRAWGTIDVPEATRLVDICVEAGDNGSRELLEQLLTDEEEHIDWLEAQLYAIGEMGIENYLAQQLHDREEEK